MSLSQLLTMRRKGSRPESVTVLIGRPAVAFDDTAALVVVDRPGMDLSALVGLPVHVLDLQGDADLTADTIGALERMKVKPLGICGPAGSCGVSPDHEWAMERYRRTLCAT